MQITYMKQSKEVTDWDTPLSHVQIHCTKNPFYQADFIYIYMYTKLNYSLIQYQNPRTNLQNSCVGKSLETVGISVFSRLVFVGLEIQLKSHTVVCVWTAFTAAVTVRGSALVEKLQEKSEFSHSQIITFLLQTCVWRLAYTELSQNSRNLSNNWSWTKACCILHCAWKNETAFWCRTRIWEATKAVTMPIHRRYLYWGKWERNIINSLFTLLVFDRNSDEQDKSNTQVVLYKKAFYTVT